MPRLVQIGKEDSSDSYNYIFEKDFSGVGLNRKLDEDPDGRPSA